MYRVFYALLIIFWILDIINAPFMSIFDTTYQVNGLAWLLIWFFIPSSDYVARRGR